MRSGELLLSSSTTAASSITSPLEWTPRSDQDDNEDDDDEEEEECGDDNHHNTEEDSNMMDTAPLAAPLLGAGFGIGRYFAAHQRNSSPELLAASRDYPRDTLADTVGNNDVDSNSTAVTITPPLSTELTAVELERETTLTTTTSDNLDIGNLALCSVPDSEFIMAPATGDMHADTISSASPSSSPTLDQQQQQRTSSALIESSTTDRVRLPIPSHFSSGIQLSSFTITSSAWSWRA